MDLDNIKKTWQEANIKTSISEDKIQQMLDNKGKSAFECLLKYERWGLIVGFICIPMSFVFRDTTAIIIYLCSILLLLIWQTYKYRFLKKINIAEMGVLEISACITKYKKYMSREFVVGIVWGIGFLGLFFVNVIAKDTLRHVPDPTTATIFLIGAYVFSIASLVAVTGVLYRFMYLANIKIIEKSIAEIKEFEKGNKE